MNLIFALLDADHFTPLVETTFWADGMRQAHFTAVAADYQASGTQGIVSAPSIAATFG